MKTVLYNTTRQWNCGDEFILFGVQNLISHFFEHVPVIWNRSPDIWKQGDELIGDYWNGEDFPFDYYIFAGSPQWTGKANRRVHNFAFENEIPSLFIGIGTTRALKGKDRALIRQAKTIICRDSPAHASVSGVTDPPHLLPCPALFCTDHTPKKSLQKIGITYMKCNKQLSPTSEAHLVNLIKDLDRDYDVTLICHMMDDMIAAKKLFSTMSIRYSYDAKDYLDIYNDFDITISNRLHGSVCSLSNGTPSIMTNFDSVRCREAARQFGKYLPMMAANKVRNFIKDYDIAQKSKEIIAFKEETWKKYISILENVL